MQIKFQKIRQLNITIIFTDIDYSPITAQIMRKIFDLSEEEEKSSPFLELSPGIKILNIPSRKKEIIFEKKRLQINDYSSRETEKSELIKYSKIALNNLTDKTKITAYGFNYDVEVETNKKINFKKFFGHAFIRSLQGSSIKKGGIRATFNKESKQYDLGISPIEDTKLLFHLNIHYSSEKISFTNLQKELNKNYSILVKIIEKI
ncbi:hypothetical protein CL633_03330 [bacterium]|nr:hypothetical protein [bacterium]|tara:strand:- start:1150 stop:1764 length:615 start_codon:yes stop_codon:yes gene_type:complete